MHGNAGESHQVINAQEERSLRLAEKIKAQAEKKTAEQESSQDSCGFLFQRGNFIFMDACQCVQPWRGITQLSLSAALF